MYMIRSQDAAISKVATGRKPGTPKTGGRVKGTPNKVTQEFRQTVQKLLDDNRDNVSIWLAQVAGEDPAKALDLLVKLAEFAAPKLGRVEHTGEGGGPVEVLDVSKLSDAALAELMAARGASD